MEQANFIKEATVVLLAGLFGGYIAVKLKQPIILGYIIAGAILTFPFLKKAFPIGNSVDIAEMGAALMLFAIGVEFSTEKLIKMKRTVIIGAVLQIFFTITLGYLIFKLVGFKSFEAFFISSTISLSSTAIAVKLLEDRQELETKSGSIMLGWLVLQDIAVVFIVIMLQNVAKGGEFSLGIFLDTVVKSFILIALALVLGKTIIPVILKAIAKLGSKELLLIISFILPLIFAYATQKLGLSFTLGAFLAGVMISESFLNHEIFSEIRPIRDVFSLVFFISIGNLFSFSYFFDNIFKITGIAVLVTVLKIAIVFLLIIIIGKQHPKIGFKVAFGLASIGEFAFLISKILLKDKYISSDLNSLIISVSIITLILAPFLLDKAEMVYERTKEFLQKRNPKLHRLLFLNNKLDEIDQPELKKHVVLCGYGRVGSYVAEAMLKLKIPFIAIDYDSEKVERLRQEGVKIVYGDASNKEILDKADVESANVIVLALPQENEVNLISKLVREINPKIKIIARVTSDGNYGELKSNGVDAAIDPQFEAALSLVHSVMLMRGEKDRKVLYWLRNIKELNALHEAAH